MIEADKMRLINGDGQICALGLPCCFLGCKKPATLCRGGEQCLCIKAQAQCPCGADAIPACMCAVCFLQCAPTVGICQEPAVPLGKCDVPLSLFLEVLALCFAVLAFFDLPMFCLENTGPVLCAPVVL